MNEIRRVINQPHGGFAGDKDAAQAVQVGHAEAMKAEVRHLDLDEELLPPPRGLDPQGPAAIGTAGSRDDSVRAGRGVSMLAPNTPPWANEVCKNSRSAA